jgi:hypothetical protein
VGNVFKGKYGGFFQMILGILGLVLYSVLFRTILTYFVNILNDQYTASFLILDILVKIAPSILFLAVTFTSLWFGTVKGYQKAVSSGINGLFLVVLGAIEIILFLALFLTILDNYGPLLTSDNVSDFIALTLVIQIAPAIIFLAGIFSGIGTAMGGNKLAKKQKSAGASPV